LALKDLRRLIAGKALIPDLQQRRRGRWHPEDLIKPLPGEDGPWRQARWDAAKACLRQAGIDDIALTQAPLDARSVN